MRAFKATEFTKLDGLSLLDEVAALREIATGMDGMDDPLRVLRGIRSGRSAQ